MNRGDIYWVDLNPTRGSEINKLRPCVIMSATGINQARRTVIVVPLSSSPKPVPPITIAVKCAGKNALAVCDQIRTVDKTRVAHILGSLSRTDLEAVEDGLRQVLTL